MMCQAPSFSHSFVVVIPGSLFCFFPHVFPSSIFPTTICFKVITLAGAIIRCVNDILPVITLGLPIRIPKVYQSVVTALAVDVVHGIFRVCLG